MYPSIQDHIMFHDPPTNPLCPSYSSLLSQEAPACFPRRHPPPFPGGTHLLSQEAPTCQCKRCKRHEFDPWVLKIPWRRS